MTSTISDGRAALVAYESLAPLYDAFTYDHDYEDWMRSLLAVAARHGLQGQRAVDVACGTGRSTLPLVQAGFEVAGYDLSPAMLAVARRRLGPTVPLLAADMRDLRGSSDADLVTCLDDAINYLLDDDALYEGLAGLASLLAPGGLLIFDTNTSRTYREVFGGTRAFERDGVLFAWRGHSDGDFEPSSLAAATVDAVWKPNDADQWRRITSEHVQRHHTRASVATALARTGLIARSVYGQTPDGVLHDEPQELIHTKLIFAAQPVGTQPR
jgi:SAM-dependent methyltransferase